MNRNVLFIVYYLPPMGASGVQRPLKFIKYLAQQGWHPIVLAPEPGAYHTFDDSLYEELSSADATVKRVEASTPFHKFSTLATLIGKLPAKLQRWIRTLSYGIMLPDNKKGWIDPALRKAEQLRSKYDIDLVFSTAPPYSNHLIAARLKKMFDLPVIMDFRDDWLESQLIEYPTRWHKSRMRELEKETVSCSDAVVVLDRYMKDRLQDRLGEDLPPVHIIPHGYDPEDFRNADRPTLEYDPKKLNLLYSGIFIHHNQPDPFLKAVKQACRKEHSLKDHLKLHFQGGLTKRHRSMIEELGLSDVVVDYGYLTHKTAVANLKKADALWFISNFGTDHKQVKSGKLFEYMGSGKPILGLIYPNGEEERLLNRYRASYIARLDISASAETMILELFRDWMKDRLPESDKEWTARFDRVQLTRRLANLFDRYGVR